MSVDRLRLYAASLLGYRVHPPRVPPLFSHLFGFAVLLRLPVDIQARIHLQHFPRIPYAVNGRGRYSIVWAAVTRPRSLVSSLSLTLTKVYHICLHMSIDFLKVFSLCYFSQ